MFVSPLEPPLISSFPRLLCSPANPDTPNPHQSVQKREGEREATETGQHQQRRVAQLRETARLMQRHPPTTSEAMNNLANITNFTVIDCGRLLVRRPL